MVIAATNRLEDLDEAVLRRFESKIFVGAPDRRDRVQLVHHYLRGLPLDALGEREMLGVAELTQGWSAADIEILCREAGG